MFTKSLVQKALATPVATIATNTTTAGAAIDLQKFNNRFNTVLFALSTGTVTDGAYDVGLEESVDGISYAEVPDERVQGTPPSIVAADDNALFQFGYIPGTARYVRLTIVSTTVTTGAVLTAVAVLSGGSTPVARS